MLITQRSSNLSSKTFRSTRSKRTDSLSSLSTTSITVILHALHTKDYRKNKNHSRYLKNDSTSSSLSSKYQKRILSEKKQESSSIRSTNQSTQTDNHSSIREQYPYGNLRRVNSNLLDYIFLPFSKY